MTNLFNHDEFHVKTFIVPGGCAHRFTFPNGYTASVARNILTYGFEFGLWEMALYDENKLILDCPLFPEGCIGWLKPEDVDNLLEQIRNLPPLD